MVVLGFFLPPVSIILMTAPIILPPLRAAGFDLVWFGVVMAVVMEMGLIHPPVGLNIFVINRIAPDIGLGPIIWGTLPFVVLMAVAVVILSLVPGIAMGCRTSSTTADALSTGRSAARRATPARAASPARRCCEDHTGGRCDSLVPSWCRGWFTRPDGG